GRGTLLGAVEGLRRRSLLERGERRSSLGAQSVVSFRLQAVVLEYVTGQLVDEVARETARAEPVRLLGQPLIQATATDYVRRSQERLIGAPILERLVTVAGSARAAEHRMVDLLGQLRERPFEEQGFGPGNLVNLLRLL